MSHAFVSLDHVQVAAPKGCEEEARRFYGEICGMQEILKPEPLRSRGGAWFQCGSQQIHIGVEADFAPAKKAHPAFVVHRLPALRERFLAHGIPVLDDTQLSNVLRFFVSDPWGNRLEFMERLPAIEIVSVQVGMSSRLTGLGREMDSGIHKHATREPLYLDAINLAGDQQVHLEFHGGVDRAVCIYAYEHYAHWEQEFGQSLSPGAFGENLTVRGMTEDTVCIGDIYRWGEAIVQVTQTRIPCAAVDMKNEADGLNAGFRRTGWTGYFFRVLREGYVGHDMPLTLLERDPHGITLAELNRVVFHDTEDIDALRRILAVGPLAAKFREILGGRLAELTEKEGL